MARGGPDLKRFMDKNLILKLNGNRSVKGLLRGYDQFMNLVLEEAFDVTTSETKNMGTIVVRGNSVAQFQVMDPVQTY